MAEAAKDALAGGETRRALRRLIEATEAADRPTVGHMVDALGGSGDGLILLLLALPSFIRSPGACPRASSSASRSCSSPCR